MMRHRKPDILLVLTLSVGLGVLVTGYAQKLLYDEPALVTEKHMLSKKAGLHPSMHGSGRAAATVSNHGKITN